LPRTTLNLIFLKVYQFVTKGCQLFSEILSYDLEILFLKILNLKLKNIRGMECFFLHIDDISISCLVRVFNNLEAVEL